jgi:hypothetical protein
MTDQMPEVGQTWFHKNTPKYDATVEIVTEDRVRFIDTEGTSHLWPILKFHQMYQPASPLTTRVVEQIQLGKVYPDRNWPERVAIVPLQVKDRMVAVWIGQPADARDLSEIYRGPGCHVIHNWVSVDFFNRATKPPKES